MPTWRPESFDMAGGAIGRWLIGGAVGVVGGGSCDSEAAALAAAEAEAEADAAAATALQSMQASGPVDAAAGPAQFVWNGMARQYRDRATAAAAAGDPTEQRSNDRYNAMKKTKDRIRKDLYKQINI